MAPMIRCAKACRRLRRSPASDSETIDQEDIKLEEFLQAQLQSKRAVFATRSLVGMCWFIIMMATSSFFYVAHGSVMAQSFNNSVVICVCCLLILVAQLTPYIRQGRFLNFWHCIFSLLLAIFVSPLAMETWEYFKFFQRAETVLIMFTGMLNLDIKVSIWSNLIIGCASYASHLSLYDKSQAKFDIPSPMGEVTMIFGRVALLWVVEVLLCFHIKQEFKQRFAVTTLLGMMCDAVVELNDDCELLQSNVQLASLLSMDPGKLGEGVPFQQVVCSEDVEHFKSCVLQSEADKPQGIFDVPDEATKNSLFHVRLRDATGHTIPMEMFHVRFNIIPGQFRHLIGLREQTEFKAGNWRFLEADLKQSIRDELTTYAKTDPELAVTEPGMEKLQTDAFAVKHMPITWANLGFRNAFGNANEFTTLLQDPKEFEKWLLLFADDVFFERRPRQVVTYKRLVMDRSGTEEICNVNVYFPPKMSEKRSDYRVSMQITCFRAVKKQRKPTSSTSSRLEDDLSNNSTKRTGTSNKIAL